MRCEEETSAMTGSLSEEDRSRESNGLSIEMVQLLVSRVLHDLSGPAGALGNGVELAIESGGLGAEVSDLLDFSARMLLSRLRVLSYAFGPSDVSAVGSLESAAAVVRKFAAARSNLTVVFPEGEAPGWFSSLLPALVMIAADCLPKQGRIEVTERPEDQTWRTVASGKVLRLAPDLIPLLTGGAASPTARTVPALFAQRMAAARGWRLDAWREDSVAGAQLIVTIGKRQAEAH